MVKLIPTKEEWYRALSERHGEKMQKNLSSATVAICGLGGLGSNIAFALARAGIGKLILIDFDSVDITNLHRQQYKANQIGMNKTEALKENLSGTTLVTVAQRVSSIKDCDTIIVLEKGKIIGIGKHEELLENCLEYREISDSQMGGAFLD